jgi:ferredoxin
MPYVITSACIDTMDQSCVEECPVSCIYVGARKLYIHPDECIDCGAAGQPRRHRPERRHRRRHPAGRGLGLNAHRAGATAPDRPR